jgi:hypothetical protein
MCRPKHTEQLRNTGIINSTTSSHLVGSFYEIYITMHESMNIYFSKSHTTARVLQRWSAQRYTLWDIIPSSHDYDIIFRFSPSIWMVAGKLLFDHSYLSPGVWTMGPTEDKLSQKQHQPTATVWKHVLSIRRETSGSTRSPEMIGAWLYSRSGGHIPFVLFQRMYLYVISRA